MHPEGRLPYSHVPAFGPYAGRGECSSLRLNLSLYPGGVVWPDAFRPYDYNLFSIHLY
jgi:hypothetical protein